MNTFSYRLDIPLVFKEGVHPGAGKAANKLTVARNGRKQPVLRGTAIAGVLRSAYQDTEKNDANKWFGDEPQNTQHSSASRLVVEDAVFVGIDVLPETVHNAHNRHTGAVYKNALFNEERIPANAKTRVRLTLTTDDDGKAAESFLRDVVALFIGGLHFGGAIARGIGRAEIDGEVRWKRYDLATHEGAAAWLDDNYALRKSADAGVAGFGPLEVDYQWSAASSLRVSLTLKLARGQDFLIAEGGDQYPIHRMDADGQAQWVLPGSTLRGLFRAWIARLAARDGYELKDAAINHESSDYTLIGWGGIEAGETRKHIQKTPEELNDPILALFGSFYARGRIHISDAFARIKNENQERQKRMHVAIDRFSGGANEGALFENYVLSDPALRFPVIITVDNPTDVESEWLKQTIKALDLGLIRIGSSKASGRFEIAALTAEGKHANIFDPKGE